MRWEKSTSISLLSKRRKSVLVQTGNGKNVFQPIGILHGYTLFSLFNVSTVCMLNIARWERRNTHPKWNTDNKNFDIYFSVCSIFFVWLAIPNLLLFSCNDEHKMMYISFGDILLNSIPSENVFVFRVVFNSFHCLQNGEEEKKREKRNNEIHEKNGIFFVVFVVCESLMLA